MYDIKYHTGSFLKSLRVADPDDEDMNPPGPNQDANTAQQNQTQPLAPFELQRHFWNYTSGGAAACDITDEPLWASLSVFTVRNTVLGPIGLARRTLSKKPQRNGGELPAKPAPHISSMLCPPLSPLSDLVQGVAMSTSAVMPLPLFCTNAH